MYLHKARSISANLTAATTPKAISEGYRQAIDRIAGVYPRAESYLTSEHQRALKSADNALHAYVPDSMVISAIAVWENEYMTTLHNAINTGISRTK